jgi:hypothetical protein
MFAFTFMRAYKITTRWPKTRWQQPFISVSVHQLSEAP